ncbi:MAG: ANTAR domain-containing protein [Oscillospiraceae bacterium]|nr:ANTAR domain-containing protein [Oscillospiraceae bacterium]MDD7353893.1 ANTAR domain-containing protein [Oscillospiraceae bacterium]MDY3937473.1 ANTAR domain-containing protein [Oscillospiraceae bacterium]
MEMQTVYSVLTVSANEKFNISLRALLNESKFSPVKTVSSVSSARRELLSRSYDLIMINSPLPDGNGIDLAVDICSQSSSGVMMFIKNERFDDVSGVLTEYGVLTVPVPTSVSIINQSLRLLCSTRERMKKVEQKTAKLEEKMEEIRIVNRAKWALIDRYQMNEATAQRFIEKTAMDECITKRAVAERIISTVR